ncbi:ABC transporter ATP-binding protein [Gymnodinialimonas ceratoperidinii]|uniref:Sn-glycerol-3-phosphate ABC transporter ATP-binding protein UgpC n=1 Tax=Gymnodinialimonas ceratoperidinii TaxID=2856823 RepID=A0A8F6TX47_9RHOB|nr:sn-glycerol-3-phosphate ABC transporter ATP-binding protein UgpC [Gymnodinialimonas ceratoperidinii]QXT40305.1 sn-glycerol-3-phosphate ABC transporter ATP-binding protein UgpC [Gymnodinialimonas ceratoperidinii]
MALLELRNVKKSYGEVEVIHGVDITVKSGEFCVFVGPSGCGKSTLLRMIAGLENITSGEIAIDGDVLNHVPASKRGLAMVFQSYALYPHMSVRNNLSFGLENISMPRDEIDARVNEAARMLQIDAYLDRRPGQLSGGQRQRVAIGRAVVREPRVFLFDEPLSNLDAELRVATRGEISELHQRLGNTMVYVTHDQVEAMTMADKIAVLRAGRLEQFGPPLELFNAPANRFVAGFIGSPKMNFIRGTMGRDGAFVSEGGAEVALDAARFDTRPGQAVELGVRPSHANPAEGEGVPLQVRAVEQLGTETFVYGAVAGSDDFAMQLPGQVAITPKSTLQVAIDASAAHLFDIETGLSCARH